MKVPKNKFIHLGIHSNIILTEFNYSTLKKISNYEGFSFEKLKLLTWNQAITNCAISNANNFELYNCKHSMRNDSIFNAFN